MDAAVGVDYFWRTEAPRKVSRHSESGGRSRPAPNPKVIAHPFLWAFSTGRTWRSGLRFGYFWVRLCPGPIFGTQRLLIKSRAIPSPADEVGRPHPPMLKPNRFCGLFPLDELGAPAFGQLFLGAALSAAYFWHTEAARKVSRHSESGGRSWPAHPPRL